MKINRLFEIVYLLLNNGKMTAKTLAQHFEISERTIYRDIETLSLAGIPVYFEKGRYGGIRLLENYIINKSLLSETEQNEILFALQSLNVAGYKNNEKTLNKLSTLFNYTKGNNDWIEIDFSRYGENNRLFFEKIKQGIINKNILEFEYHNTQGEKSKRKVEPLKLWFKEKAWYLFAYCQKKKDIRQFKVTRIKNLKVLKEHFEHVLNEFEIKNNENFVNTIKIIAEINKSQAYRVYDDFCEENICVKENGNFEIIMECIENEWLYGYLLSFGEFIKIIEPVRIKEILREKIEKMRVNY